VVVSTFELNPVTMPDEVRAGGRIPLIIGRGLTTNACKALGMPAPSLFITATPAKDTGKGYTLAQKWWAKHAVSRVYAQALIVSLKPPPWVHKTPRAA